MSYRKWFEIIPLSWSEANRVDSIVYLGGRPCKEGHKAGLRYTSNRKCFECAKILSKSKDSIRRVKQHYASLTHKEKMLMWAKYRHERKYGGVFDLAVDDLEWPEYCPALGIKLRYEAHSNRGIPDVATLDRVDSNLGYVKGNIQVLSRKANLIKTNATAEEVMKVALFMKGYF